MSKLILCSNLILDDNDKVGPSLNDYLDSSSVIGYIPSTSDFSRKYYNFTLSYFKQYNISNLLYFDLDEEYNENLVDELLKCDAIFLSGGNTFKFLHSIKKRNFVKLLQQYYKNNGILETPMP